MVMLILGLIAAGLFIVVLCGVFSFKWFNKKVHENLEKKNAKKVVAMEIGKIIKDCDNKMSLDELEKLKEENVTHLMATIDDKGEIIGDIEEIKATEVDPNVDQILNSTGEGMIVIEK